jgi:Ca2+-binding EF-hand superfamily protein
MNKLIMLLALGMVAMAASATDDRISFSDADANQDGAITRREAAAFTALERAFDAADDNHNGLIEPAEYVRMQQVEGGSGR